MMYKLRKMFPLSWRLPCYVRSHAGALHYLSSDPIDDCVLDDVLGTYSHLYFPTLSDEIKSALSTSGWILDVGAFNGFWSAEMLMRFPSARAILLEPNPRKYRNALRTLRKCDVFGRSRPIQAGLALQEGTAWMAQSAEGSWGNWIQAKDSISVAGFSVSTVSLERVLDGVEPVLIKCNAEGAEFGLIEKLASFGVRPLILILMFHPEHGCISEARRLLETMGYRIFVAFDDERRPCWHAVLTDSN